MYTFEEAIKNCNENLKIIYGSRSEAFHLIDEHDRDFNTNYASTKDEAIKLGEVKVILKSWGKL